VCGGGVWVWRAGEVKSVVCVCVCAVCAVCGTKVVCMKEKCSVEEECLKKEVWHVTIVRQAVCMPAQGCVLLIPHAIGVEVRREGRPGARAVWREALCARQRP